MPLQRANLTRRRLCAGGVAAIAAPAWAAAHGAAASAVPVEVTAVLPTPRLQGSGKLRFFGLEVYDARLWVGDRFAAPRFEDHAFALELQYARTLQGAAIAQRSIVEMRRAGNVADSQAKAWEEVLASVFPNVVSGDRLTGVHQPAAATRFFHNSRPIASVADPAFGRAFFGIWLAETTSEPALRRQLIGPA
jgi:hypothetical protein